jgi:Domain of unknown function (DUF4287)/Domain of unknown function (DUF5655)
MPDPAEAAATQLRNIESSTGRSVGQWAELIRGSGVARHGEIVAWLKTTHHLTHGNANALAHAVRQHLDGGAPSSEELLDAQYAKAKAALRPILDRVIELATALGSDVGITVQKTAVSIRRQRQFAMVEAPSAARVRLGFNNRGAPPTGRVKATTGMCTHSVDLSAVDEIDDEVLGWLSGAYHAQDE